MRIVNVQERTVEISRYKDPTIPSGGLTTSIVAIVTDVIRSGKAITGYGFSSIGRFGQGGLIRERFAPRLLKAPPPHLSNADGTNIDPNRAWNVMMANEKPGGHGERCVAVGTLDMAIWDAAAKIAGLPLYRLLRDMVGRKDASASSVEVYASGGYRYPSDDHARIRDEIRNLKDQGYSKFKMKIGAVTLDEDLARIDSALTQLPSANVLAVDAMNAYSTQKARLAAAALAPYQLRWFEDICEPLDFGTHEEIARSYRPPIAAGEALFSVAEAKLLDRYGGLRRNRDILLFDPVHCYGLPGYIGIVTELCARGWPRSAFWPHGGHLFSLHVADALGLGGAEMNPLSFQPFGGLGDDMIVENGRVAMPDGPGIGFERKQDLLSLFRSLIAS